MIGALLNGGGMLFSAWQELGNSTDGEYWDSGLDLDDDYFIEEESAMAIERGMELPLFLGIGCCIAFLFVVIVVVMVVFALRSKKASPSINQESTPKTTHCPDCGGIVSKRAESCPHCGAPIAQTDPTG